MPSASTLRRRPLSGRPVVHVALSALVALSLGLLGSEAARAAQPTANEMAAQQLFGKAVQLVNDKRYTEAAKVFEQAYQLDPDPGLLMNAARAYKGDNKLKLARERYWQVVGIPNLDATTLAQAKDMMAQVEAEMRLAGIEAPPLPPHPTATTTTVTTTPAATAGAANPAIQPTRDTTVRAPVAGGTYKPLASGILVPGRHPQTERPYMLSVMKCYWNGMMGKFQNCSTTNSWGGNVNFDITPGRTRSAGNGLVVAFEDGYFRKPYCSVEFQNFVGFRRVDAKENALTIYLHAPDGADKPWKDVSTWVTVICQGVN